MTLTEHLREYREGLEMDYIAAVEAERFLSWMRKTHPAELEEWMTSRAVQFITVEFSRQERQDRAIALRQASRRAFATAAEMFTATGDSDAVTLFAAPFVVSVDERRRPLADMTAEDCRFAGRRYVLHGRRYLAIGAFFAALSKKVGTKTVAAVMSEAECERLFASFCPEKQKALMAA